MTNISLIKSSKAWLILDEEKYKKHGFDLNKLNKQQKKEEDDSFCGCSEWFIVRII